MSFYVIIRNLGAGVAICNDEKNGSRLVLLNSLVTAITVTLVVGIQNYMKFSDRYQGGDIKCFLGVLVITFIVSSVGSFIILSVIKSINNSKQRKIQDELDSEEEKFKGKKFR